MPAQSSETPLLRDRFTGGSGADVNGQQVFLPGMAKSCTGRLLPIGQSAFAQLLVVDPQAAFQPVFKGKIQ